VIKFIKTFLTDFPELNLNIPDRLSTGIKNMEIIHAAFKNLIVRSPYSFLIARA
jgi:hypothetical protein